MKNRGTAVAERFVKHWRITTLVFFVVGGALVIILRLYMLQVIAYDDYRAIALDQHRAFDELIPRRGEIFAKNGKGDLFPLALNRAYNMAYAVPRDVMEIEKTVFAVSAALNLPAEDIRQKLSDQNDVFEILKHRLSEEEVQRLRTLDLPGIKMLPERFRFYPGGDVAAHVLGFVGSDGQEFVGRYGMEAYWEAELQGKRGTLEQERAAGGGWISVADRILRPADDGVDIILTIDYTLQFSLEEMLRDTIKKHGADAGSVVVLDPKTGKILALAAYPTFNPNDYGSTPDIGVFVNPIISHAYEPGSVFKPITMAMGIDTGVITPETTYVDTGRVSEAGYTITNADEKVYGVRTMMQVLEESINTGAIHVEKLIGNKTFANYVERFGFGEKTGVVLPGEAKGNTQNLKEFNRDIQFFTASFGQGIAVTPLQLASAYATIANGGMFLTPQIVDRFVSTNGREVEVQKEEKRRVISIETARTVGKMLRSVVVNGHGKRADVPGYLVGGKTGTAQVAKSGDRGYEENASVGTFAGYAPIDDPQFVMVVKIDNPRDVIFAESSAAPAFGEMMKYTLEYYGIVPTEDVNVK